MARYNDISHFRAPYKDSVLQGFGAFGAVSSFPTEIKELAPGIKGQWISRANNYQGLKAYLAALSKMYVYFGAKSQPDRFGPDGNPISISGVLCAPQDKAAVDATAASQPQDGRVYHVVPADQAVGAAIMAGLFAAVPVDLDPAQSGKILYLVAASELPAAVAVGGPNAFLLGPGDKDLNLAGAGTVKLDLKKLFATAPAKKGPSIASIAGYTALGLLIAAGVYAVAGKRKGYARNARGRKKTAAVAGMPFALAEPSRKSGARRICPSCGGKTSTGDRHCGHCGVLNAWAPSAASCKSCGGSIKATDYFCGHCGRMQAA